MDETFTAVYQHEHHDAALGVLDQQARDWFGVAAFASLERGPVSAVMDVNGVTSRRTYTLRASV